MRTLKGSKVSSDPQQWNKVFNSLVHILETQQIQLESLSRDRKFLEDRIKLQYDRWVSDVNLFQIKSLRDLVLLLDFLGWVYPSRIPDLLSESPLIVSGRYKGDFPETLKARGILADMSNFVVDLKVQKAKDIPIDKGCGSSKRKLVDVNPVSETPKLFTSAFKVPKLKNSSCLVI
ncbi:hypothetical protein LOK49_LG13G00310 [Camellia lanceoleosa]|uniref:Uncharacterized protein n=2 Tax=Camellia lanceoleosa TaxID=1840588 RepID=A0ACC0FHL2_9ERIC|nr:hypothetical protein LOK49_LG13G00310 [Camellia lanceoleosa]